ncbi:MAG TPA: hypothetical protein VNZ50_06340 [Hyphomicrobiaceae bacterium]|nr:hypothetical protein [Hyphomicrobiaceae bacterium]
MAVGSRDYERRSDAEWLESDNASQADASAASFGSTSRAALEATIGRAFHMRVLKEIAHLSQNYPALPLVLTESKISIPCTAPDGFAMSIETERGRYVVHLGEWRDEFALADEAVELIESALRGEIRVRIDIGPGGRFYTAERRLPSGDWISLPHFEDNIYAAPKMGPTRTIFLRNGPILT